MESNNLHTVIPQAIEIEEAVIGAALLHGEEAAMVITDLPPEVFFKEAHRAIWQAIRDLNSSGVAIDLLTVTQRLKKAGTLQIAGGAHYLSKLTNRISSPASLQAHQLVLRQTYISRRHREVCQEMYLASSEETSDPLETLDRNRKALDELHLLTVLHRPTDLNEVAQQSVTDAKRRADRAERGEVGGVPTGLPHLDQMTGGWQKGDLIILAARPSMGKTSMAMNMGLAAAKAGKKVRIFSLEVRAQNLVDKMILSYLDIDSNDYRLGYITASQWETIEGARKLVGGLPVRIDDHSSSTFPHMKAVVRGDIRAGNKPDLVIIDYLQLATPEKGNRNYNRENEVAQMSRAAKAIAKDLDIPVILLSQMSREVEKRKGNRPQLSDLRESGAIEQDADLVVFLWRPWVYGKEVDEHGNTTQGMGELVIAKHRNGPLGVVPFRHSMDMTQFWDISRIDTAKEMKILAEISF
jgi:replicative DNA helicase